jgi:hypothetical protein
VFIGQIAGKWTEGGWVVLISFSVLVIAANLLLISPIGYREPKQIYRIVREKARVQGAMASIVEWQSLKMQEYRHSLRGRALVFVTRFFELFGVRRPVRYEPEPIIAGDYDHAVHSDHPEAPSLLAQYIESKPRRKPKAGGAPKETAPGDEEGKEE